MVLSTLSTFPAKGKPGFSNRPKKFPKIPPDRTVLYNWVFDSFVLVNEPFAKTFWSLETCVLVNNNLYGKLFSSSES